MAAQLTAVQALMRVIEAELVRVAEPLAAYRLLLTLPGIGPTVAAILVAEIGDIRWYTKFSQLRKLAGLDIIGVQTGQWASGKPISKAGRALLRWALYQAAVGAARSPGWRARREALIAKRAGDRYAFFKANVELAAKLLRLVWGVWRSGRPYDPGGAVPAGAAAAAPPRRAAGRPQGAVRVTLCEAADGRVRFAFREPAEMPRPRRDRRRLRISSAARGRGSAF